MSKPTKEELEEMKAMKYYVKYALIGKLQDHELYGAVMKISDWGQKVRDNRWTDEDVKKHGPKLEDMKGVIDKFVRMTVQAVKKQAEKEAIDNLV